MYSFHRKGYNSIIYMVGAYVDILFLTLVKTYVHKE